MNRLLPLFCAAAICTLSTAAAAEEPAPIDRPMTLPQGELAPVLGVDVSSWVETPDTPALNGAVLKAGFDYGATPRLQVGLVADVPILNGAAIGSIFGDATFALNPTTALRFDAGAERLAPNGEVPDGYGTPATRFAFGFGVPLKIPLTQALAFVSGSSAGASTFNRALQLGNGGAGFYTGASAFSEGGADNLVVSYGRDDGTIVGLNLPIGLMVQPDPHISFTLRAGYSAVIGLPNEGAVTVLHFVPIGLDIVYSPVRLLDIGASVTVDGYVGQSGGYSYEGDDEEDPSSAPGYFDMRSFTFFLRFHLPL